MTKEQFAILLKAKHLIVPQVEDAIAYLNSCDVDTAVQGHYNLYLIAHNELNSKVSDIILNSLLKLVPKTTKTKTLANIYCIIAADYLKKRKYNKAINLYFEYKNLLLDDYRLNYNFDGFMLVVFGENQIYSEYKKLAKEMLENPYFNKINRLIAALSYYNNIVVAEETNDDEFFEKNIIGLNKITIEEENNESSQKLIYLKELVNIFYKNYRAKTSEEESDVINKYKEFVNKYKNEDDLKVFKTLSAHLNILETFIKNKEFQFVIKHLNEILKQNVRVNVRVKIYEALCKCYKEINIEKYYKTLEKLTIEYNKLNKNIQENLSEGINNTIKLYRTQKSYNEIQRRFEIDQMTGCFNRNVLRKKSLQLFNLKGEGAVIFFDLDNLKKANDSYNHSYGDEYLRLFVRGVQDCLPSSAYLFRYGGDEFVITTSFNDAKKIEKLMKKIYSKFSKPIKIFDKLIKINFSAGVALFPLDGNSFEEVLNKADLAMYEAKKSNDDYKFVK